MRVYLLSTFKTELNPVKQPLIKLTQVQTSDITGSFHRHYDDLKKLNNVKEDLIFRNEYQLRGKKQGKAKRPPKNRFLEKNYGVFTMSKTLSYALLINNTVFVQISVIFPPPGFTL